MSKLFRNSRLLVALTLALALGVGMSACSDDDDNDVAGPVDGEGRITMYLTDAPGDYEEVNIIFEEVWVHLGDDTTEADSSDDDSGWMMISSEVDTLDLLQFSNGDFTVLADTLLPAGHYTQVRLLIGEGSNVVVDGMSHDLTIPSGPQSGLKLTHGFDIVDGVTYEVTLDFDADRSITVTGNDRYMLRPTIRLVSNAVSGAINGVVLPLEAQPMVTAISSDEDTVITYADTLSGVYNFIAMPGGDYSLLFSATAGSYADSTLTGITVTAGQATVVDTLTLEATE